MKVIGNERRDAYREGFDGCITNGRQALLPVNDEAGLALVILILNHGDVKPSASREATSVRAHRLETDARVEGNDDSIRDHRAFALKIATDLGDVRQNLRSLVSVERIALPSDAGYRRERWNHF